MLEPNDSILQACLLGTTLAFSGSPLASILSSSSAEPFSFGFSSSQAGTTVLLARCTHVPLLLDQPIFGQLASSWGDQ
jgi:ABC-type Fe3+-siderophore transport system permease subunit